MMELSHWENVYNVMGRTEVIPWGGNDTTPMEMVELSHREDGDNVIYRR